MRRATAAGLIAALMLPAMWAVAHRHAPETPVPTGARALDGRTLLLDGVRYRLWGVPEIPADKLCALDGQAYDCRTHARLKLQFFMDGAVVECFRMDDDRDTVVAVCFADGADLAELMALG